MSYFVPENALADLKAYQQTLLGAVGKHLISAQKAKEQYWERLRVVLGQSYQHTDDEDRMIAIQCSQGCNRVSVVRSDVKRFTCVCSPVEQFTFQCRTIDFGASSVESMLRRIKPDAIIQ